MNKITNFLYLIVLFLPINASAEQEQNEFILMKQAVEYSAKADAYNTHCNKDSVLADDYIKKFEEKRGLTKDKKAALLDLKAKYKKETDDAIEGIECKDLEFMMKRLEVMRHLKDVSYILNGVDPSTLPQIDIPDIEGLLPPKNEPPVMNMDLMEL